MQVYVYTLSFGSLCAHRSVNPRGNASAYTPAKPVTVATPDPAARQTVGLQVTHRRSRTGRPTVTADGRVRRPLPEPILGGRVALALTHRSASRCVIATHPTGLLVPASRIVPS